MSNKVTLTGNALPRPLVAIPGAPKKLYVAGSLTEVLARPRVAIVGSRKVTTYGKLVTAQFASELARAGVVIVSGLALGVDGIAHKAALEAGGITAAVLPTGLDKIYPSAHHELAKQILAHSGALLSEYPEGTQGFKGNFIARNRLVSGLSDAVLITEAAEHSGTLHTAEFATKQGKPLLVIPGNITSLQSAGTNNLLKSGATAVTGLADVLSILGISAADEKKTKPAGANSDEQLLIDLLWSGVTESAELLHKSGLDIQRLNQTLTMLEISGTIHSLGNGYWALS